MQTNEQSQSTRTKGAVHAVQPLFQDAARGAEVEPHMSLAIFAKYGTVARSYFGFCKEKIKRRFFELELCEIQPGEVRGLGHCYPNSWHIFGDVIYQKVAVASEIEA